MHITFTGGGTLGPVTPLLAVAAAIKAARPDAKFSWIGTKDGPEAKFVAGAGIDFHAVSSGKLRRYFSLRNVTDVFRILKGYAESRRLLKRLRPDVVVSAGGFVAVPVAWAAGHIGIPVHVHQQDIRPGLANKLSMPHATSVSVAFEKSLADFPGKRPFWTGNPVRPSLFTGSKERAGELFGLEAGVPTILVIGGGTGSSALNGLASQAASIMVRTAQVVHLTGAGKGEGKHKKAGHCPPICVAGVPPATKASGEERSLDRYRQIEFLADDMRHAYAAADLVVTRAGMGVLTELSALGLPAVIVPIPGSHQVENAAFFEKAGAALVIDEATTFSKVFAESVLALLADDARRGAMRQAMLGLTKPDAAKAVSGLILALAERRQS
jgi:UDP-N-acetylglucosamine--N-acetylmuramyl-(pentapeptide) pyrophosphoryl-undecaprenol N-acetylglucosamine transferase